jgi:Tn3 transposase DDE domain-containing protein
VLGRVWGSWTLLDSGLPLSQLCPGLLANEIVVKKFFDFTYFHGLSAAHPHGRRLLTRSGKVSLLQISLVYINTLMIQQVFTDPTWWERMKPDDLRALTPLIDAHITPYGTFELDMQKRLHLEAA